MLWSLGWALIAGACLGVMMGVFADISPVWIAALAIGALPGLLGSILRPAGVARLALMATWGLCAAVAAILSGGLTGPLGCWCLTPLLAAVALGGGLLDGLLFAALALATVSLAGAVMSLPPAPRDVLGLSFAAAGATAVLIAAAAALLIARRRVSVAERTRLQEIGELQVLLGDLPHMAVALDRDDSVYAVFGQSLPGLQHADLYGGLVAAAAPAERGRVGAAFTEALDHGDSEISFTPVSDPDRRFAAALRRTASGGVVAVLRDVTGVAQSVAAAPRPTGAPPAVAWATAMAAAPALKRAPDHAPPVETPAVTAAAPPAIAPATPNPQALEAEQVRLLSLTARLEEARVRAQEADKARLRAEAELATVQVEVARLSALAVQTGPSQAELDTMNDRLAAAEQGRRSAEVRAAKVEQTLQARSRFLANMSHELRTPLNAIMGFSDIMRARMFGELTPKYGEYADLIHESGRHLMDLISDVLDMSKIEAERFKLSHEVFDGREGVNAALRLMRAQADDAGVKLRGVMPATPIMVNADRRALKQIVLNLVSNALKFTPRGGYVSVTTHSVSGILEIAVSDTGIGIAPEDLARLGRPFEQAGDQADQSRGTGLGLSLVKAFAQLHGGDMSIESQLGEGTAVLVRMPVLAPTPFPAEAAVEPHPAPDATPEAKPEATLPEPLHSAEVVTLTPRQG